MVALVLVGAGASLLALAGTALRVDQRLPLASSESREVAGPLGSRWLITSEGLSSYEELNRLVSAVLLEVRRGKGRTRIARVEWRQYLNSRGDIIAQDIPVAGVVNGALNTVVITPAEEPQPRRRDLRPPHHPALRPLVGRRGLLPRRRRRGAARARRGASRDGPARRFR